MVMFLRSFVVTGLSVYLVVYLTENNYSLENASQALALWSFAGIGGALAGGTLSDRIGRRRMMVLGIVTSALLLFVMLNVEGVALILVLILLGFTGPGRDTCDSGDGAGESGGTPGNGKRDVYAGRVSGAVAGDAPDWLYG